MKRFFQSLILFFFLAGIVVPQTVTERVPGKVVKPHRTETAKLVLKPTTHRILPYNMTEGIVQRLRDKNLKAGKLDTTYHPKEITVDDSLRTTYTYDDSGNVAVAIIKIKANGIWFNYDRYTYTYNSKNMPLTELWEIFDNGAWVKYYRFTYTYVIVYLSKFIQAPFSNLS